MQPASKAACTRRSPYSGNKKPLLSHRSGFYIYVMTLTKPG
ncbi:hypothetical protein HMPREF9098_2382 [Kingella denitrificans ATCC 33394]|uniref:Uncharacterized protein n=1 Tax=Kingella denitrificans ATCC 33394 TaxID=888741 RepID=F0F2N6_9NEIS|nr:hypothetical protein HMPREF9098_2382 [Kingella denitrificans ATCC 33394]